MVKSASDEELKALKHIHTLMLALERSAQDSGSTEVLFSVTEAELAPIQTALGKFSMSESSDVKRLADIARHLKVGMSAKQFSSWIVPVERVLGRELRDDQFMIYSEDAVAAPAEKIPLVFVLDNLRSAFNVGSIFRTAECFGVTKIYLAGYTPLPDQEKLAKTAMGTDHLVPWESVPKTVELLIKLANEGIQTIAFETTSHAVDLGVEFLDKPAAFVFGNERFGLESELLKHCSEVRKIPLRGAKNSLNVGVAAAIATYEFSRQYSKRIRR